jgi:hypothetical protein
VLFEFHEKLHVKSQDPITGRHISEIFNAIYMGYVLKTSKKKMSKEKISKRKGRKIKVEEKIGEK